MKRDLKSQIRRDAKRVFLNPADFAVLETLKYWRRGDGKPPEERRINIVVDEDANISMYKGVNKSVDAEHIKHDQRLYRMEKILFCALEDFNPPPRKGRRLQVGDHSYSVLGVMVEGGIVKITMRELEE